MQRDDKNLILKDSSKIGKEDGFLRYLEEIKKFPILTEEEEYEIGMRFKKTGDKECAKQLIQSHLRLVVKMAMKFKNYGLPITDIVSEGNLGLIQAVKKFDPEKGFRFSTYSMWWIRAYIQEYILRSWSLVKIGTTIAQRKLFFNLQKIKRKLEIDKDGKALSDKHIKEIADNLNVSKDEVREMNSRMYNSDTSLNNPVGEDSEEELIDKIAANQENQEQILIKKQEKERGERLLSQAFSVLNEREKDILIQRQMSEVSATLEELSQKYNISRERIRQIETVAIDKIRKEINRLNQN